MKPLYTVAVLCFNHLKLTQKCLASISASADYERCQVIVIDNGSTDGTREWLAEIEAPPIKVVLNTENTGIQAYNHALSITEGTYLVCLNNDVVVCGDWLARMRQKFLDDPMMAIVGIREGPCYLNFAGVGDGTIQDGIPDYIEGACMMVRADLVKKHGLYDPAYRFCYCEDSDLSLRLRKLGYHIAHVPMNGVKHVHDASMSGQPRDIEGCHAINHVTLRRRWGKYLKTRSFVERIAIKRSMAMGDVLLTTPVIHALKKENAHAEIDVCTQYPEIFRGNPDVHGATNVLDNISSYDRVISLDECYERTPNRHIADSYAEACGVKVTDYFPRIYPRPEDYAEVDKMREHGKRLGYSKWAVVHQGPRWGDGRHVEGRTLTDDLFLGAIGPYLHEKGYGVFEITDSRTPLSLLGAIIGKSELFVGADSGPMHIAQAMMTPTVGIFGAVNPFYRLVPGVPFLHGVSAWPEDCGCLGCHHLYEPPMLTSQCIRTGDNFNRCMKKVKAEDVFKAIDFVLEQKKMYLETSKIRALVLPHLVGKGIDIGCQRDPITPDCVAFDKNPTPETTHTGDARKLPFHDAEFDFVWSSHCLEDIPDTEAALVEWLRVLKPGGVIALYVPHPELYHGGNADHVHPGWRPEQLAEYLTKLGCSIVSAVTHDLPGPTHPAHSSLVIARKS